MERAGGNRAVRFRPGDLPDRPEPRHDQEGGGGTQRLRPAAADEVAKRTSLGKGRGDWMSHHEKPQKGFGEEKRGPTEGTGKPQGAFPFVENCPG